MSQHAMDNFMAPRSVAVIGATRKTGDGSFNVIENMRAFGYEGEIYPVNPFAEEISSLKAFKDVKDIPGPVDIAIIFTPREQIPGILEDCAMMGIKGAIVVPQGFADADEEGKRLQDQLTRIAREKGIRVLGPNTLGIVNAFSGFISSFMPQKREKVPVGVICQSGIFFVGASIFSGMMGKGIDVANGCDLDFADALETFGDDEDINTIFVHIEGINRGRDFFQVAQKVARKKPIIAYKTATTQQGAKAASSHSGSLVGDREVFEAAFRQAGVISARNPEEVTDFTKAFLNLSPMKGNRVGVITFTGAGGVILIDSFEKYDLVPATLSPSTIKVIKDLSPPWMPIGNPMDIWPAVMKHGLRNVYRIALENMLQDPEVDGVICIAIGPRMPEDAYLDATGVIKETAAAYPDKPVAIWLYGPNQSFVSQEVEKEGHVIAFPSLPRAARTLAALKERHRFLEQSHAPAQRFSVVLGLKEGVLEGPGKIQGKAAQALIEGYGIPVAKARQGKDLSEVMEAAEEIGYPVALKIESHQIAHKTDVEGISLNLNGPSDLKAAYKDMMQEIKRRLPGVKIDGVLVQEMAESDGVEVILGAKKDPQFGPVILFGTGGIYTDVWKDISYGIAPLTPEDASRMIQETKCFEILKGARKDQGYDVGFVVECLLRMSQLMLDMEGIEEVDLNPLKVFADGGLALDVRVITAG